MTARPDRRRRWRLVLPFLPVLALIIGSLTAHVAEEPDPSDAAYLSPTGAGPDGASRLADLIRARGVTIHTVTGSEEAVRAVEAADGDATLFIPTPQYVYVGRMRSLYRLGDGVRVVLVEPGPGEAPTAVGSVGVTRRRWATAVAAPGPGCKLTDAGPAAVARTRYGKLELARRPVESCYGGGLVGVSDSGTDFVFVGSADPFRAARIAEHDNERLAVDLLSRQGTLVWLDLHEREPAPPRPPVEEQPDDEPSEEEAAPAEPSPFPDWLFWVVLTLLAAVLTLALARGRRLGAPVPEALPVEVPGAETATGRGRLYRRARARGPALEVLRAAARRRLAATVGLPAAASPQQLVDALHARTGQDPARLGDILFGPEPQTDEELHLRAVALRHLVQQVTAGPVYEGEHR